MERVCVLLLLTLALAESFSNQRGIILNLDNGELCLSSLQCKSRCCHRENWLTLSRCADKAAEFQECSRKNLSVYYKCPCESGLTCETTANTGFGICHDSARQSKVKKEKQ
ncbi:colipase [Rhineura floridana]|uniref:colipase n=1 Tax=Rhineura floridana TaxID=261503 RepID=UPI002AC7E858|nr:colipase [Rhineura floridana]